MQPGQEIFTKEGLIQKLTDIAAMGWIENGRHGNHGGIGDRPPSMGPAIMLVD
jgi:hypothetical protein